MTRRLRLAGVLLAAWASHAGATDPTEVNFASADARTMLRGFLFQPSSPPPWPAIVMLHGRGGPYSAAARGVYEAATLSQRHQQWGRFWAARGYLALHVDSFGPRGYPQGFPIGSYAMRPAEVNEQTVRPLDAYGALAYLRSRGDVIPDRIGLHGWSNGAMAGLATIAADPPGLSRPTPERGFRAALLFYPACRIQVKQDYRPYAPAAVLIGSQDEEVSPQPCKQLAGQVRERGITSFDLIWYEGATHSFDDPGRSRQSVAANRAARADSMVRAESFFRLHLRE